jgi:hypothetical protein
LVALLKASNDLCYRQKRMIGGGVINKTHLIAKGQGGLDVVQQTADHLFSWNVMTTL